MKAKNEIAPETKPYGTDRRNLLVSGAVAAAAAATTSACVSTAQSKKPYEKNGDDPQVLTGAQLGVLQEAGFKVDEKSAIIIVNGDGRLQPQSQIFLPFATIPETIVDITDEIFSAENPVNENLSKLINFGSASWILTLDNEKRDQCYFCNLGNWHCCGLRKL